jgi:2,3-bisphosphoglycerate-dependent phosphoglycerate mutase
MATEGHGELMLLRHGASEWNEEDRFTGWTDVPLSESGRHETKTLGLALRSQWRPPSLIYVSELSRVTETVALLSEAAGWHDADIRPAWQLNERDYGELEGWRRPDVRQILGPREYDAVHRGWADAPPRALPPNEDAARARQRYPRRKSPPELGPDAGAGESLAQVSDRVIRYWLATIRPQLASGHDVLVVGHSNSLRVLVRLLRSIPESDLATIDVAVCQPILLTPDLSLV